MIKRKQDNNGFALLAAIGVLAVAFILVGTVAITARGLYEKNGRDRMRAALSLFTESGLARVKQGFRNQEVTKVTSNFYKLPEADISARVEPLAASSEPYAKAGLVYKDGDIKAIVAAEYKWGEDVYRLERTYLTNLKGQRKESILLAQKITGKGLQNP